VVPALPALALIPIVATIPFAFDFGLGYHGGAEAWSTGHPEPRPGTGAAAAATAATLARLGCLAWRAGDIREARPGELIYFLLKNDRQIGA
jgi:hypothetical protein